VVEVGEVKEIEEIKEAEERSGAVERCEVKRTAVFVGRE
jgi:hypothetical protein